MKILLANVKNQYILLTTVLIVVFFLLTALKILDDQNLRKIANKQETGNIERINNNGFGNLATLLSQDDIEKSANTRAESGGGGERDGSAPAFTDSIMPIAPGEPYPNYSQVNFKYTGDDFSLSSNEDVYKRNKKNSYASEIANKISGINIGEFNLGSLRSVSVDSLHLSEQTEFGYSVYLDPKNFSATINANWEKWPKLNECDGGRCVEAFMDESVSAVSPLIFPEGEFDFYNENNIDRDKVIGIAENFIDRFDLNMSFYDGAEIAPMMYPKGYSPQSISIKYPLSIGGKNVYDVRGNKRGVSVEVNMPHERVTYFGNITGNNFTVSSYKAQTNKKKILNLAEKGGLFGPRFMPVAENTVLELDTPENILMHVSKYKSDGFYDDFFVPALGFPIIDSGEHKNISVYLNNNNIIVIPLVNGFIDTYINKPMPLPVERMDAAGGASGTSTAVPR